MTDERPNPDALLQQAQEAEHQEKHGKLKIYLGAAPGVGKTYAMLSDALASQRKGLDIVVGIVETHKREEVQNLLDNFTVLPRITVDYHGKPLLEFDLDAALKRHPGLILIDEMAHTNAIGLRHKKRWQDIKELLDRGINVYTTLNVQHIESLNNDVSQIIQAHINETIPDSMIELADSIELIDIPPEDLLVRLSEGKVYLPSQAVLAAESFFRKGNLIALRELALRTLATRVNAQALLYRQGQGIKQIWPIKDKILICVGAGQESHKLIRAAKRLAVSLQAEWIAVYVDTTRSSSSEEKRNQAIQNLQFAEQLGAETRVLTGFDIVKEVIGFSCEQNITLIMLWKHIRNRWKDMFMRSLADEILRHSGDIDVYTMTGDAQTTLNNKSYTKKTTPWLYYMLSTGIVVITTAINFLCYPFLNDSNLVMVYLLGITTIALFGRVGPSLLGTILSVSAYDFFFIPPYYSFSIEDPSYYFTLVVMLAVAQIISHLTLLTRRQTEAARQTASQTSALYTLSRKLSRTRGSNKLLQTGINYISELFYSEVIALVPQNERLVMRARSQTKQELDEKEQGIAQWVYELGQKAGLGTDTLSYSKALYLPLSGSRGTIGVLRIQPFKNKHWHSPEKMHLLEACANQIALALEVDSLQEQQKTSELITESNRVRSALLRAVSYDLRTPLVAIMNTANTQIELAKKADDAQLQALGETTYNEAEQLHRLINNLLQINYLESEKIILKKELLSLEAVITLVIKKSKKKLGKRPIQVIIVQELPALYFDNRLLQEVLLNLLDNATKFTPKNSPIKIGVTHENSKATVSIEDQGPGISSDEVKNLFEKFYRGRKLTSNRGLGLGLAICRIIIEAHGGKIWMENFKEGGAAFRFTLPTDYQTTKT
ncbi:MAG: DUF4118 domain-containing protein [Legionellales bacterium]